MNYAFFIPDKKWASTDAKPFHIYREQIRPAMEAQRAALEAMYALDFGRPAIDPVLLMGITLLQRMEGLTDRQAVTACFFDVRWRWALGLPEDWAGFDPSTLVHFRARLVRHDQARCALTAGLNAMRKQGYLKTGGAVRIDSTHVGAATAAFSRLECVRETLRLALKWLLRARGNPADWEPWAARYADRRPKDLRDAPVEKLKSTMDQAGQDMGAVLAKVQPLGNAMAHAQPIALLRRVFDEQYEVQADGVIRQRPATPAGAVHNPHDPDATWSTKASVGSAGWVGYKLQVCETAPETNRQKGEPTEAVITAVVTQPAITSDHGSLDAVLAAQARNGQAAPETTFTDAGYISAPALVNAEAKGYELCGPAPAPPHSAKRFGSDHFEVDVDHRRAVCPAGKSSAACSHITETKLDHSYYYFAWAEADCAPCPLQEACLSKKKRKRFRTLQVGDQHMIVQARRKLCRTPEYQARMRRRNAIEATNSEFKRGYGLRRARYRGIRKTDVQTQMSAAACNLRRWATRQIWLARHPAHKQE